MLLQHAACAFRNSNVATPFDISRILPPVKNRRTTIALSRHHYLDDSFQHSSVSNPVQRTGLPCSGGETPHPNPLPTSWGEGIG